MDNFNLDFLEKDQKNKDIIKGIEIGLELERKSKKFYKDTSKIVIHSDIRNILLFLVEQEQDHIKILINLKKSLNLDNKWVKIGNQKKYPKPELFKGGKTEPKIRHDTDEISILLTVMRVEKQAENFYKKFSKKLKNKNGKIFFNKLAEFEFSHYRLIEFLYESFTYVRFET